MGEGVNQNISTNSRQKMTASEMLAACSGTKWERPGKRIVSRESP